MRTHNRLVKSLLREFLQLSWENQVEVLEYARFMREQEKIDRQMRASWSAMSVLAPPSGRGRESRWGKTAEGKKPIGGSRKAGR